MKLSLSYKEWKQLQKQFSTMSHNDGSRFIISLYQQGFDDAKKQIGISDGEDAYICDEERIRTVLRKYRIGADRAESIIKELENGTE